jgi:hypothetical protein
MKKKQQPSNPPRMLAPDNLDKVMGGAGVGTGVGPHPNPPIGPGG